MIDLFHSNMNIYIQNDTILYNNSNYFQVLLYQTVSKTHCFCQFKLSIELLDDIFPHSKPTVT